MSKNIKGFGGGGGKGGGGGSSRVAIEAPDTLRSIQYANVLDLISEGEIEGLVDGAKSVYLDDTPLQNADGTYNFQGVTISSRTGTQSQDYIAGFAGAEAETAVGVEVKQASPVTRSLTNANNTAVRITLSVPSLTHQNTTNGDINGASVDVAIDVQTDGGGFVAQEMRRVWSAHFAKYADGRVENTLTAKQFQIGVNWSGLTSTSYQTISFKLQYRAVGSGTWFDHATKSFAGRGSLQRMEDKNTAIFTLYYYVTIPPSSSTTFDLLLADGFYEFRVVKLSGSGSVAIGTSQAYAPVYYDTITGKTSSKYQRAYRIALPAGSAWDIRVRRITADSATLSLQNKTFWDSLTEIVDAKLTYPNSAIVGMQIDAEQFNRIPVRGFEIKGLKVKLPSNYNPLTRTYTGAWDGTFNVAWTDNPAWVFYDIVTNDRYGIGDLISEQMVDKWGLYSIAQYCDAMIDDGFGGLEPRFTCNLYIQTRAQAYQVITNIASIFRSMVYWSSGAVYVSQDAPQDVAQIFSPANVVDGMFNYSGSSAKVRHTVALVTWNDPQDNYLPKIEYVSDNDAIIRYGVVQTDVVAAGCTSRGQAHRVGRSILFSEQLETETVSFKAGLDAVFTQAGQIIQINDPNRAGKRMGGRIVAADVYTVTLDAAITVEAGKTYEISCRLEAGTIETRTITNAIGEHTLITLSAAFSTIPLVYAMWIISINDLIPESWRVVSMAEIDKTQVEIVALEYRADKYAAIENGLILEALPTSIVNAGQPLLPENLTVIESLYLVGIGVVGVQATVSWNSQPGINNYLLTYSTTNENPVTLTTKDTSVDIKPLTEGDYVFTLFAQNSLGRRSQPQIVNVTIYGKTIAPNDVSNLQMIALSGFAHLTWNASIDLDVIVGGYLQMRYTPDMLTPAWSSATDIGNQIAGNATSTTLPLLTGTYLAKWVDSSGNASSNAVSIISNVANLITMNVVETVTESPVFTGVKTNTVYDATRGGLKLSPVSNVSEWGLLSGLSYLSAEGGIEPSGTYIFDGDIDLGSMQTSRLTALLEVAGFDANDLIGIRSLISTWGGISGANIDDVGVALFVRTTNDDPLASPVWAAWQPFFVGDWTARAFQFKADLSSQNQTHNVLIKSLAVTVDMPDRDQFGEDITSGTSAYAVTYTLPFMASPALGITAQNMQTGDYYTISSKTNTGFSIQFFNVGASPVNRTFDFHAKGY
ncbi:MAG: phage tail protein [Hydrogenophaga sp.]|nr:phage tail protein [Hydrogenophaga sp.]